MDGLGNAYIAGNTYSADFPVTPGAFQRVYAGRTVISNAGAPAFLANLDIEPLEENGDAFVVKLSPDGTKFVYSTFVGGTAYDYATAIAVDADGNAYITGATGSADFPVTSTAFQRVKAGVAAVFLAVLNSAGSNLIYSTFIGGSKTTQTYPPPIYYHDFGRGIAIGPAGEVYITGLTMMVDFPTTPGAFRTSINSPPPDPNDHSGLPDYATNAIDTFLVKFAPPVAPQSIVIQSIANAASLLPGPVAAGQAIVVTITNPPAGSLSGTITDSSGYQAFVSIQSLSGGQLRTVLPDGLTAGPATLTIQSSDGRTGQYGLQIALVSPGLFSASGSGYGAVLGAWSHAADGAFMPLAQCQAVQCVSAPMDWGAGSDELYLQIQGTGFRGQTDLSGLALTIGGQSVDIISVTTGSSPGVDVLTARAPRSLFNAGELDVTITAGGLASNTVTANFGGLVTASPGLKSPRGLAIDANGALWIADTNSHLIRRYAPADGLSTVAGTGVAGFGGDGGPAAGAILNFPQDLLALPSGGIAIADTTNHRVRLLTSDGVLQTLAGTGVSGTSGDGGPANAAQLANPSGLALDSTGNLYVADYAESLVRVITPDANIGSFAGNGSKTPAGDRGPATSAGVSPWGVFANSDGSLLIIDYDNAEVRKVTPDGVISTLAGTGHPGFEGDGGPATAAQLAGPYRTASDVAGNLYLADALNNRVRRITPDGRISTVAGTGTAGSTGDGGRATDARLNFPTAVALDAGGYLYILEGTGQRLRKVTPSGVISTVVSSQN